MDQQQERVSGQGAWERVFWLWEIYFFIVYAIVFALVASQGNAATGRVGATAALTGIVVLYGVAGRRLMRAEIQDRRSLAFVGGVSVLFLIAVMFASDAATLLFALCPMVMAAVPLRPAIAFVVLVNLLPLAVRYVQSGFALQSLNHGTMILIPIVLSIWLGVTINRVVRQSEERAELIDQLERSRAEVARLSHEAGVTAERARLAGEIHDTLAQGFASIITLLQASDSEWDRDLGAARGHVALAVRTARENLAESRALVTTLAPFALNSGSLEDAIRRQVERTGEETRIVAHYQAEGAPQPLPTAVEVVLLRTVQEALSNVRKHSGAREVTVRTEYAEHGVRLVVADDGRGFDPERVGDGFGLHGMRARATQLGAILTIHSGLSRGTTIELQVPR